MAMYTGGTSINTTQGTPPLPGYQGSGHFRKSPPHRQRVRKSCLQLLDTPDRPVTGSDAGLLPAVLRMTLDCSCCCCSHEVDIYKGRQWVGGKVASFRDKDGRSCTLQRPVQNPSTTPQKDQAAHAAPPIAHNLELPVRVYSTVRGK
jgi:hypothetical protein